jgi:hypothetical protein
MMWWKGAWTASMRDEYAWIFSENLKDGERLEDQRPDRDSNKSVSTELE